MFLTKNYWRVEIEFIIYNPFWWLNPTNMVNLFQLLLFIALNLFKVVIKSYLIDKNILISKLD